MRISELHAGLESMEQIVSSRDARKLYLLNGEPSRGALVRYNPRTQSFHYILPGVSGLFLDYSRDGEWVTYQRTEDNTPWVSRTDGSDARQLTWPPESIELPRFSPNGKWIAYMAQWPGRRWRVYLQPREGGK